MTSLSLQIGGADLHIGDALTALRAMPSNSVDCICTSPPYWGLRDYGAPAVVFGGDIECEHNWQTIVKPAAHGRSDPADTKNDRSATRFAHESDTCQLCGAWRGQLGLEPTIGMFIEHLAEIFRECKRVLKPTGTCWVNMGDSYYTGAGATRSPGGGTQGKEFKGPQTQPNRVPGSCGNLKKKSLIGQPWRLTFAMMDDGWTCRSDIIWEKPSAMPESAKDRPTRSHEYIFMFTKSERYWYDPDAISEKVTGNAHTRGSGINPKAVAGWNTGPGSHCVIEHTKAPDLGGANSRMRKNRVSTNNEPQGLESRMKSIASERLGRGPGWRRKQNESFSSAVSGLVETRNARTVWTIASQPFKGPHFATFPEEVPRRCILAGCPVGGVVLDIFVGSGTTLKVAIENGRKAIGIDVNPSNVPLIKKRLASVTPPLVGILEVAS